ncbi:MAG: hypothetical protein A2698_01225 [Candidatus Levybacteria bacterium RIFCSPHIGHO2_01_FULL_42_15]|nr:MAG: hypothetical protein A2698_01225 [Candidatus Levybacteria bacterium RIFCSPHIGHO2_01_FULL_42_15]
MDDQNQTPQNPVTPPQDQQVPGGQVPPPAVPGEPMSTPPPSVGEVPPPPPVPIESVPVAPPEVGQTPTESGATGGDTGSAQS